MSIIRVLPRFLAVAALLVAAPALAQTRSAVTSGELDAAVVSAAASPSSVNQVLATDAARNAAGRLGLSATELSDRVATMDPVSRARAELILAGGADSIVISTTAIIIGLLLIILLVD